MVRQKLKRKFKGEIGSLPYTDYSQSGGLWKSWLPERNLLKKGIALFDFGDRDMEVFLDRLQLIRVMVKDSLVFSIPEQLVLRHTPLMLSKLSRIKQALMRRHIRGILEESTKVCLGEGCGGRNITLYPCSCPMCNSLASSYFFNKDLICSWFVAPGIH